MDSSSTDPLLVIGGAIIIALLLANLVLLLRRERDRNPVNPAPPEPAPPPVQPEPLSQPGLRGYVLHGFDENGKRARFEFGLDELRGEGVLIGRSRDARAQLSDTHVGRAHARLRIINDRLEITDLNTLNKTFLNGNAIEKGGTRNVEIGTEIGFGPKVKLRLARLGS